MTSSDYQRLERLPDLEAEFHALPTSEGGRLKPAWQGYRTEHDFGIPDMLNVAQYEFFGDPPNPGETRSALVWLSAPELQNGRLFIGMQVAVKEAARTIGYITISKILNKKLLKDV